MLLLMCRYLCGHMFLFLSGIYLAIELLGHIVNSVYLFEILSDCFPKQLHQFIFLQEVCKDSSFLTSSPMLMF